MIRVPQLVGGTVSISASSTSQVQPLNVTVESVVQALFLGCKTRIIQVLQSIREIQPHEVEKLKDNNQHWKQQHVSKENFKIGDRVIIKLKKRQLKQQQQMSEIVWDELIVQDFEETGTVIGFLPDGALEPIVYFHKSGRRWVFNSTALTNVSGTQTSDGSDCYSDGNIKVGDYVEMAYEQGVVKKLQNPQKCPLQNIFAAQHFWGKVLSFDGSGYAYVSLGAQNSLLINAILLKPIIRDRKDLEPELKTTPDKIQKTFPLNSDVTVTSNVQQQEAIFKQQVGNPSWNYKLTQIFGAKGKVTYHGLNGGEIGVTIKEKRYILPHTMLERKSKKERREQKRLQKGHAPYVNEMFPYAVGDLVFLAFAYQPSFERTLHGLNLPTAFATVCQNVATFLGYTSPTTGVVSVNGDRIQVNTSEIVQLAVKSEEASLKNKFDLNMQKRNALKVGDEVQLDVATDVAFWCAMQGMSISQQKRQIIVAPSTKLVAFDDERDLAVLQFQEKFYTVESQFIKCPDETQAYYEIAIPEMPTESEIDELKKIVPVNMKTTLNDISECLNLVPAIRDILQSLEIPFEHQQATVSAGKSTASFSLLIPHKDSTILQLERRIRDKFDGDFKKERTVLSFVSASALVEVKMTFTGSQEETLVQHEEEIVENSNENLVLDKPENQPCTSTAAENDEEPEEANEDEVPLVAFGQSDSDGEDDQVPQNPPATTENGTIRQNVSFDRSTKEIVIQCNLNENSSVSQPNPVQTENPVFNRQNSLLQGTNVRNTYNIFNPTDCNFGTF